MAFSRAIAPAYFNNADLLLAVDLDSSAGLFHALHAVLLRESYDFDDYLVTLTTTWASRRIPDSFLPIVMRTSSQTSHSTRAIGLS
ncbi:MAG: hypothetical protein AAF355_02395 [Myxococcota bacterium]